jgi:predicted 3-demethylubiquinone-9 3-methyltransferase (glyoxalase superfamily)
VATFSLNAQEFMAIDSNREHPFTFTPAISLFITCETQQKIDELWEKHSEGGATGRCGWLSDQFGVSWQVVPSVLGNLLQGEDRAKSNKVMHAMLQMTKLDIATLERAYERG